MRRGSTARVPTARAGSVLVTGAAGGLGAETARRLADSGWTVFAGDLAGPSLDAVGTHPRVSTLPLDVTDQASIDATAGAIAAAGGLDAVVNFAGILTIGSMAELPVEEVRRVLEVNVLGTYRVNRAIAPLVIARRGRIVNISSETGHQSGGPFNGAYAMSKHAIEAYSDSLRRELGLLGVRVIKIQPGPFRTSMTASIGRRFEQAADSSERFGDVIRGIGRLAAKEHDKASDPAVLAEVVRHALSTRRPKAAYSVRPARSREALDLLPTRAGDLVLGVVLRRAGRRH